MNIKTTSSTKPRIGVIGLGLMGRGIAGNYARKGFPLTVWNRSRAATAALAAEGVHVADSPRAVAERSDFILTAVSDPAALEAVTLGERGFLAGAHRTQAEGGLTWIDTSTIGSKAALHLGAHAEAHGVAFLEAPVTGSKNGARDGTLVVMTGGTPETHATCEPILAAFASKIIYVGPLGSAAVAKLVGNTVISFMLEGLAEGAVLGAAAGVSLDKILEIVQASGFASPYWAFKGGAMVRRDFETHFSLDLLHKDQALMLDEGAARRVPLPALAAIHQVTNLARALGHGGEDIAAQLKALEALAGKR